MCGIIGYLGNENANQFVIEGLTLLQNRGYDSVGISSILNNELQTIKFASTNTYNSIDLLKIKWNYTQIQLLYLILIFRLDIQDGQLMVVKQILMHILIMIITTGFS